MKLGIAIEGPWGFLNEVYAHLAEHHLISLFKRRGLELPVFNARISRYLLRHDMQAFMRANDVVFFEWATGLLATASHLPKACGIVTRLHRYEIYQWADEINWDTVDKVILVSKAKQREFTSRFPKQAPKVVVIPEAIALDRFQPRPKQFNGDIGILCHLRPRKRIYDLILTFCELTQQREGLHLHIGGGSRPRFTDYYDALHRLVQELNLQGKVTFYGYVTNPQDWYHHVDIFISNSYSEGLQVAPMEAIASGCYCLSHRWDGADELLPEENLYYTNSELKEKILDYCEIPEAEKQRKKAYLREIVSDKFDVNQTRIQIRQVIEDVGTSVGARTGKDL